MILWCFNVKNVWWDWTSAAVQLRLTSRLYLSNKVEVLRWNIHMWTGEEWRPAPSCEQVKSSRALLAVTVFMSSFQPERETCVWVTLCLTHQDCTSVPTSSNPITWVHANAVEVKVALERAVFRRWMWWNSAWMSRTHILHFTMSRFIFPFRRKSVHFIFNTSPLFSCRLHPWYEEDRLMSCCQTLCCIATGWCNSCLTVWSPALRWLMMMLAGTFCDAEGKNSSFLLMTLSNLNLCCTCCSILDTFSQACWWDEPASLQLKWRQLN